MCCSCLMICKNLFIHNFQLNFFFSMLMLGVEPCKGCASYEWITEAESSCERTDWKWLNFFSLKWSTYCRSIWSTFSVTCHITVVFFAWGIHFGIMGFFSLTHLKCGIIGRIIIPLFDAIISMSPIIIHKVELNRYVLFLFLHYNISLEDKSSNEKIFPIK